MVVVAAAPAAAVELTAYGCWPLYMDGVDDDDNNMVALRWLASTTSTRSSSSTENLYSTRMRARFPSFAPYMVELVLTTTTSRAELYLASAPPLVVTAAIDCGREWGSGRLVHQLQRRG